MQAEHFSRFSGINDDAGRASCAAICDRKPHLRRPEADLVVFPAKRNDLSIPNYAAFVELNAVPDNAPRLNINWCLPPPEVGEDRDFDGEPDGLVQKLDCAGVKTFYFD